MTIDQLNHLDDAEFINQLSEIYEHSIWVAKSCVSARPFNSIEHLHQCMQSIVEKSDTQTKLDLLNAHPLLSGKQAQAGTLTDSSTQEQKSAALDQLNKNELDEITLLNQTYLDKFSFPFIIAVKNYSKAEIFNEFKSRISNSTEVEFKQAINQVHNIALIRLTQLLRD